MASDYLSKPLSKLRKTDRELLERALDAIESKNQEGFLTLIPNLVDRGLVNHRKAVPMALTLLNRALDLHWSTVAEKLLAAGAAWDISDFRRTTPLMKAATFSLPLTKLLLSLGARVGDRDSMGLTPLHWSAGSKESVADIIKVLVHAGADINAKDNAGRTPLHEAVGSIDPSKVRLLLELGADRSISAHGILGVPLEYLNETIQDYLDTKPSDRLECIRLLSE